MLLKFSFIFEFELGIYSVADLRDGKLAVATPREIFFHFFAAEILKKGVTLPGIRIKNRFSIITTTPSLVFWIRHCIYSIIIM